MWQTDAGTRVPLIANWPKTIPAKQVCPDLIDFSDFLPTLCEAAQRPAPASLQLDGRSFYPQLLGKSGNPRQWTYCWYARNGKKLNGEFVRNHRFKLYRNGQFFDLENDVLEKNPLATNKLADEAKLAHQQLESALQRYTTARPKHLPVKPRKQKKK